MSLCHYVTMSLCHYVMLNTLVTFQIKFKSLKLKFMIHTSLLGYCSSSTGYKSEKTSFRLPKKGRDDRYHVPKYSLDPVLIYINVFLYYRVTPEVPWEPL